MKAKEINILVTGGAGHIGSTLSNELAKIPYYKVTVVDNLLTGRVSNLSDQSESINFIEGDINDNKLTNDLIKKYKFDYIFHYAAVVGVRRTQENPIMVLNDIFGIRNVLDLAIKSNCKRIFFASSSEVYGEPVEIPQHEENTPLNSRIPYAVVENLGETFLRAYQKEYGLSYSILRFFNTYGPLQSDEFVITRFIKNALSDLPLTIYGDGKQSRTFMHVRDNVSFTLKTLNKDFFINEVVNVGSSIDVSILELADIIKEKTGSNSEIIFLDPLEEGDMRRRRPDISKFKEFYADDLVSLEKGITELIVNLEANLNE